MEALLSQLAKALKTELKSEKVIKKISIDSRDVDEATLFVAIKGERFDGHDFVKSVAESGAAAAVCSKRVECEIPVIYVEDTRQALLELASFYRKSLKDLKIIGLTGSVGKTTTKEMTACVLSQKAPTLRTEGNLNNEIGVPKTLFRLENDTRFGVIEMGMDGKGQISELSRCAKPDCAIITNIGMSHIENLGSREGILNAKLEMLDGMEKGSPLFLNGDDDMLKTVKNADFNIITYGIENPDCDFKAENIREEGLFTYFEVHFNGKVQNIKLPTVGIHNVYDALAAFSVGSFWGVEPSAAAQGLMNYVPSGMRQKIVTAGKITVIEDCYNASPDSQRAALNSLCSIAKGRKIAVIGDMLELGEYSEQAHRELGEYAAGCGLDALYTYGKEARFTADSAYKAGMQDIFVYTDKQSLKSDLENHIKDGDTVLFKASRGMRLEEVIFDLYKYWE